MLLAILFNLEFLREKAADPVTNALIATQANADRPDGERFADYGLLKRKLRPAMVFVRTHLSYRRVTWWYLLQSW